MNRRVIGMIVGAVLILGLIALAWLWFLGRSNQTQPSTQGGETAVVPTSQTVTTTGGSSNTSEVNPADQGENAAANQITGGTYSPSTGAYTVSGGTYNAALGTYTLRNAILSGGTFNPSTGSYTMTGGTYNAATFSYVPAGGTVSYPPVQPPAPVATSSVTGGNPATTTTFVPPPVPPPNPVTPGGTWTVNDTSTLALSTINQIRDVNASGSGKILYPTYFDTTNYSGAISSTDAALASLGVTALACSGYATKIAGVLFGGGLLGGGGTVAATLLAVPVSDAITETASTINTTQHGVDQTTDLMSCITRVIAKQLLANMTKDIVNWINGGFTGQPAFVQNQQAFFANVANQTAGQVIAGSGLAFLCSPFSVQVRIAIAQAYASRTQAPACTLTDVIQNVNGFFNGNFNAGGWPGILAVTSAPQNNPFGAFAAGQITLNNRILAAQQQNGSLISATGFIAQVPPLQQLSCSGDARTFMNVSNTFTAGGATYQVASSVNGKVPCPAGCNCNITTPGQVISDSLAGANKSTFDSLNMAKNFDEVISALITQLVQKTLYNGLSSLSDNGGYGGGGSAAQSSQAASLASQVLSLLQQATYNIQQYAGVFQNMAHDVQQSQTQFSTVKNCWSAIASSTATTGFSDSQIATAKAGASAAQSVIDTLQQQVNSYNATIATQNDTLAYIEQLQTQLLNASTVSDVQNVQQSFNTNVQPVDIGSANSQRLSIQSQLYPLTDQANKALQQCHAMVPLNGTSNQNAGA